MQGQLKVNSKVDNAQGRNKMEIAGLRKNMQLLVDENALKT
jgi:hypothetical protein